MNADTERLVGLGEGYWCYEVPIIDDRPPMDATDGMPTDAPVPDSQLVYRPVHVETTDEGEPYAWFYDPGANAEQLVEDGGKTYVPIEQVHVRPLSGAEPAYRHE